MTIIDHFFKNIIDEIFTIIKNRTKVQIKLNNYIDPNTTIVYKGIEIINNSKNDIIINDINVLYYFDTVDIPSICRPFIKCKYQEVQWTKDIIETNSRNYIYISIKINNKKIIKKKIKL